MSRHVDHPSLHLTDAASPSTLLELEAATAHLDPPFAAVDLGALAHNAHDLVRRAAGKPIRVASKSIRCPTTCSPRGSP